MKTKDIIKSLESQDPEQEVEVSIFNEKNMMLLPFEKDGEKMLICVDMNKKKKAELENVIGKTKLAKSLAEKTVYNLQHFLHENSRTDEEKMDLIAFERIMRRINKVAKALEILLEEGD